MAIGYVDGKYPIDENENTMDTLKKSIERTREETLILDICELIRFAIMTKYEYISRLKTIKALKKVKQYVEEKKL